MQLTNVDGNRLKLANNSKHEGVCGWPNTLIYLLSGAINWQLVSHPSASLLKTEMNKSNKLTRFAWEGITVVDFTQSHISKNNNFLQSGTSYNWVWGTANVPRKKGRYLAVQNWGAEEVPTYIAACVLMCTCRMSMSCCPLCLLIARTQRQGKRSYIEEWGGEQRDRTGVKASYLPYSQLSLFVAVIVFIP